MKKSVSFFLAALLLISLFGCGADTVVDIPVAEGDGVSLTCRVVEEEDGRLTLAEMDGSGVYTLSVRDKTVAWEDGAPGVKEKDIEEGSLVNISFSGVILESWPMEFGGVTEVCVRADGFNDMCGLYLDVLEDLWEEDEGLNYGILTASVDLRATSLSPSEQAAVRWVFGNEVGVSDVLDLSVEELAQQGLLTVEDSGFTSWEEGIVLTIAEEEMEGTYSLTPVTFDAWKWRSSLGAYFFSDCTAVQTAMGSWSDYQVGAHMIS